MKLLWKILLGAVLVGAAAFFLFHRTRVIDIPVHVQSSQPVAVKPIPKILLPASSVRILVYHSIDPAPNKPESAMALHYRVTPETFAAQMKYLKDNGYTPITLATLVSQIKDGTTNPKEVVLTFDDGWRNQYVYAVPVMEQYGFTATFGIITKNIGPEKEGVAMTDPLTPTSKMTWAQIKDLQAKGFEIDSHSETHPFLTKTTDQQLQAEIVGSKQMLEKELGVPVTTFIYPYYNYDARVMKAVQDAGYDGARAGFTVSKNDADHLFNLAAQEVINDPDPFVIAVAKPKPASAKH